MKRLANLLAAWLTVMSVVAAAPMRNPSRWSMSGISATCSVLTAADVQQVTGKEVHNIAQQSIAGAGGRCANSATSDGKMFLGVSQLTSVSDFKTAVAAVPESVYPKRDVLKGIGDEAILMKDDTGKLRYLVARKGNRGVILFPSYRSGISDEQLRQLAIVALSR